MSRLPPVFEEATSPLTTSNDGRLSVARETQTRPPGFSVADTVDNHVEHFTMKREIADAFVAGYDYRERLNREGER